MLLSAFAATTFKRTINIGGPYSSPTIIHLVIRGQSQAEGYLATDAITVNPVANALTLGPNSNGKAPNTTGGTLVPLFEVNNGNNTKGETIATALAQQLLNYANNPNITVVVTNHSQNSQTIQDLSKGGASGKYEESIAAIARVKTLADADNKNYECHMVFMHGGAGLNPYDTALTQLIADFRADTAAYVTKTPRIFADQIRAAGDPDYSIQAFNVLEDDANGYISHPRYGVEYGPDDVHLTNHGTRHSALLFARSIFNVLYGNSFQPLQISNGLSVIDNNIYIPIIGAQGALQGNNNFGLEAYNVTDGQTVAGTFAIQGFNIVFSPTTPLSGIKVIQIRANQGATGVLYSLSTDTVIFNNASAQPYALDKYLSRQEVSVSIDFDNQATIHTLNLAENQSHTIDLANNYPEILPGDTVIIPAGTYKRLRFENFVGDVNKPLTIINGNSGRVEVTGDNYAIGFYDANYIKLTGSGSADQYGFQLHPTTAAAAASTGIGGYASGLEIEFCEVYDCGFAGFFLKRDLSSDTATWRRNYQMNGLKIHNCHIHDVGGEGFYLGTTISAQTYGAETALPHQITNCEIYSNLVENTQWDGIQLSQCPGHKVYDNIILNYGLENQAGQNKGIAIANESTGLVYNNFIKYGLGTGIECFGMADNTIFNNIVVDPGENGIFINDNAVNNTNPGYDAGTNVLPGYLLASNTIIRPGQNGVRINGTDIDNKKILNNIVCEPGGQNVSIANAGLNPLQQGNAFDTVANLLFVDAANDDYNLAAGSPARDIGADLTEFNIAYDFDGTARPINTVYDAGAFEGVLVVSAPTTVNLSNNSIAELNALNAVIGVLSSDGSAAAYSLGGADAAAFNLNNNQLRANQVFDFETKSTYQITVTATNAGGSSNAIAFTINITDVAEGVTPSAIRQVPINSETNGSSNNPRGYIEYLPEDYEQTDTWPVIIWLHGQGEAGNGDSELSSLLNHAIVNYVNTGNDIPYLMVAPQSFNGYFGADRLKNYIDWLLVKYGSKIDASKIHIACVSASGAGIDNLALNYASTLALINTVTVGAGLTGNGGTAQYNAFVNGGVRSWWHHGDADITVGFGATLNFYKGIVAALGGQNFDLHRYTLYAGMGHSAWQETYDNSGASKSQITGIIDAPTGNYYLWNSGTWYQFLEGLAPAATIPSNLAIDNNNINENATGLVGSLSADGFPAATFAITGGADAAKFSISGNQLILDEAQDFETTPSLAVEVTASNSEGNSSPLQITVNINDVAEGVAPSNLALSNNVIDENSAINTVIGTLSADGDDPKTYAISGTDAAKFAIQNTNELIITESPDFETQSSYSIQISSTNAFGTSAPQAFTINVNDVAEGGNATEIMYISVGRANTPQATAPFVQFAANIPDNTVPSSTQNGITCQTLTTNVWLSSQNATFTPPTDLQGFQAAVWQNGWSSRFGGDIELSGMNPAKTYNLRIAINCSDTSVGGIDAANSGTIIRINGNIEYTSQTPMQQGTTANAAVISNLSPNASGIMVIRTEGIDATYKFGHICGFILEEN